MTKARTLTPLDNNPLHAEAVHMVDGLTDNEMNSFLEEHPTIVPLFEIDVLTAVETYLADTSTVKQEAPHEPNPEAMKELGHARDALDWVLAISQRIKATTLEEVNLGSSTEPRTVKIAKDLVPRER